MNYYQVLGIDPCADQVTVKKAYRSLLRLYHPDQNGGNRSYERHLDQVRKAYEVLGDPALRREYDDALTDYGSSDAEEPRANLPEDLQESLLRGGVTLVDAAMKATTQRVVDFIQGWGRRRTSPHAPPGRKRKRSKARSRDTTQ